MAARRAVALMEEAVGLHREEAELLGRADCPSAAAPLPCTPAVARAFLALAVDGEVDAAGGDGDGDEGGSAFGMQLERIFNHAVARAKPQRSGQPSERLLGLQASDRLHAFGRGCVESDDEDDDDDDATEPTRFGVGARVECREPDMHGMSARGVTVSWRPGTVSALWVSVMCPNCPQLHLHAYRVLLDGRDGAPPTPILVEDDDDFYVRSASQPLLSRCPHRPRPALG